MKSNSEPSPGGADASLPEPIAVVGMGGVFPGGGYADDYALGISAIAVATIH